jgi:DNA polymerase-4
MNNKADANTRKIIHIDMDCFYAAIEIRDNPMLANLPVAVGGRPEDRSVLCTCNYIARKYGVRSAMPSSHAMRLCPALIILPVNMQKYRAASTIIQAIFKEYTLLVEPLSLDEAYLDVTNSPHCKGSATWIAKEMREKIVAATGLTASAGIAPNKFLAKIASGWKKPNNQFAIVPAEVAQFVKNLPIKKLFGVGKVTAEKLNAMGLKVCSDLYDFSLNELIERFGKLGIQLYNQSRGIDNRPVEPNRVRKSLSVEQTFLKDIKKIEECHIVITELYQRLIQRLTNIDSSLKIKNQYLKIKYSNFKLTTVERISDSADLENFQNLLSNKEIEHAAIRLIGIGVHFQTKNLYKKKQQQELF